MSDNSKNILLISYYFAPNNIVGAKRFSWLSEYLSQEGFTPHILTIKEKYIQKKDESLVSDGVVHRCSVMPNYPIRWKKINRLFNIMFGYIDPYIGWVLPGVIKGYSLIKKNKIKTVLITAPPFSSFMIPYLISYFKKLKVIFDYRDPWFLYRTSYSPFKKNLNRFIEKKILKKADVLVFNTNKTKNEYCRLNTNLKLEEKSFVIPNGFIPLPDIKPKKLEEVKKVIVYAGNIYGERSLNHLFRAVERVNNEEIPRGDCLAIHIFGSIHAEERENLNRFNISSESTVEHDRVNFQELLQYLKGADILYLSQGKDHEYSVPYKLIDYLSVRKPILAVTSKNSATHEVIEETNCGETAFIEEPDSVYEALKKILLTPGRYNFAGAEKYSFEIIAEKYIEIIKKLQ